MCKEDCLVRILPNHQKEKNKLWKRAKNALKLSPIRIGERDIAKYLKRVREANELLIKQKHFYRNQMTYKIGEEDIEIIANYLKWGINVIYTSDLSFFETCKILRLKSKLVKMSDYAKIEKRM